MCGESYFGCVDDLSAEVPGKRSALAKLHATKRGAGDDPNDLTRPGTTATTHRALALFRVSEATQDLRDHIGANSRHRIATDSASGPGETGFLRLLVSNTPIVHNSAFQQAARLRPCGPACATWTRCKKGNATEPSAEPSLTKKANTQLHAVRTRPLRQAQRVERRA